MPAIIDVQNNAVIIDALRFGILFESRHIWDDGSCDVVGWYRGSDQARCLYP